MLTFDGGVFIEQEKVKILSFFTDVTGAVRSGSQMLPVRCGPVHRFYRCGAVRFTDVTGAVRSGSQILPVRSGPVHRFSRFGSVRFSFTNGTFFLRSERWPPLLISDFSWILHQKIWTFFQGHFSWFCCPFEGLCLSMHFNLKGWSKCPNFIFMSWVISYLVMQFLRFGGFWLDFFASQNRETYFFDVKLIQPRREWILFLNL